MDVGLVHWRTQVRNNPERRGVHGKLPTRNRARQLYKNISMLFLFPVKKDLLYTNI